MRILVTGGAGFIGSHLADRFLELGHEVIILDNLSSGNLENVPKAAEFMEGDIVDTDLLARLFSKYRFDVVSHHAAQIDVRASVEDPAFDARVNILGTINLLEASRKYDVPSFMFASTGGVIYGEQQAFPAAEDHPTNPICPYGISKLACEKYLFYYHTQFGLRTVAMRYANVYGPRQNPHGEAGVIAIFSDKLVRNEPVIINGDGRQTRDYIYVGDVVEANARALEYHQSLTINVGTGIETDVVTLYQHLARISGSNLEPRHGPAKTGELNRSVISPELARIKLGWKPATDLEDGLADTYSTFKE